MKSVNCWHALAGICWFVLGCVTGVAADETNLMLAVETPPLMVGGTSTAASGWLNLRNSSASPANISLRATDLVSATTGNHLGAGVNFYTRPGGTVYGDQFTIPGGSNLPIWMVVTNVSEAGQSTAQLYANGLQLTNIMVSRWNVPFNVSVAGLPTGTNELVCERWQPVSLALTNADAVTYRVHWEFFVNGTKAGDGDSTLPPNSETPAGYIRANMIPGLAKWRWRDSSLAADVILGWDSSPQAMLPVRERMARFHLRVPASGLAKGIGDFVKSFVAIFFLVLGAAGSWALNLTLPNVKRRGVLGGQITALADRTHSLSTQIDSSLRVLLRVQRLRYLNVLSKGTSWSPATSSSLDTIQAGITSLDRQVTIAERMDRIYDVLSNIKASPIAPTTLAMLDDSINQACRLLRATRPTEADLQSAEALVKDAEMRLTNINRADDALALMIARRVQWVNIQLPDTFLIKPEAAELRKKWPELLKDTPVISKDFEQAAKITVDFYLPFDIKSRKLELLARYLRVLANLQDGDREKAITNRESKLIELLSLEGYVNLQQAQRLVSEMEEGVFAEGVEVELTAAGRALIDIGQSPVRLYEPVQCRVVYRKPEVNASTARNEFSYEWDFGDGLQEKGLSWTVWHFFRERRTDPYPVTVNIFRLKDGELVATLKGLISVESEASKNFLYFSDKAWAETARVALALLAPMLALVSGAREKLLGGQDMLTAALAIFLMGFTANAIKDMLIGSPATAASNAVPANLAKV